MKTTLGELKRLINEAAMAPFDDDGPPTLRGAPTRPVSGEDIEEQEWGEVARVIDMLGEFLGMATAAARAQDGEMAALHLKNIASHARRAAQLVDTSGS